MVRIVNYQQRESDDGNVFFALIIQGGVELVQSKQSSNFYATARKTSISSTFDEETCKSLLGTEIPGKIVKLECESYDYTIKETGEIIQLSHKYHYVPNEPSEENNISSSTIDDFVNMEKSEQSFSMNGVE